MMIFHVLGLIIVVSAAAVSGIPTGRVVGGSDSFIERYPFMVSIRDKYGSHSCGGSIVAPYYVLTAAHCTAGRRTADVSVQYGVTIIDVNGPNVVQVKRITIHRGYNPSRSYDNDISLLKVEHPFPINYRTVAPVRLPKLHFNIPQKPEGGPGVLIGWGYNHTGGLIMKHLQEVDLKIYSNNECILRHNGGVTENHICGGVDEGGKGQCSGDSGGPLLYKEANQLTQVGLVSWSVKPCTVAPYPGVYTKVANYIDWIEQNIKDSN